MTTEKIYKIDWSDKAKKSLKKLNRKIAIEVYQRVNKYLVMTPYSSGEPLKGEWKGYWKYRCGDYRVIYRIVEDKVLIEIFKVKHRKESYESFV